LQRLISVSSLKLYSAMWRQLAELILSLCIWCSPYRLRV